MLHELHESYINGKPFKGVINDWLYVCTDKSTESYVIQGNCVGHPNFLDGRIRTSRVVKVTGNLAAPMLAETLNSVYALGTPAK